jgi:hypothetical protein
MRDSFGGSDFSCIATLIAHHCVCFEIRWHCTEHSSRRALHALRDSRMILRGFLKITMVLHWQAQAVRIPRDIRCSHEGRSV